MRQELNKSHLLAQEVSEQIKELTRHPQTNEYTDQDYSYSIDMVDIFIQSGFSAILLEMFWQRKSDGCPLDVTERDEQLNEFEEWLKYITFENTNDYQDFKMNKTKQQ
jgi:hypothetical protein